MLDCRAESRRMHARAPYGEREGDFMKTTYGVSRMPRGGPAPGTRLLGGPTGRPLRGPSRHLPWNPHPSGWPTQARGGRWSFCERPARNVLRCGQVGPTGQAGLCLGARQPGPQPPKGTGWGSKGKTTKPVSCENGGHGVLQGGFHSGMFPSHWL